MKTKNFIAIITALIIVGVMAGAYYYVTLSTPRGAHYLIYYPSHITHGGKETKVLLLDSKLRYGVYDHDFRLLLSDHPVKKGNPCVIINVTIRNDYKEEYPRGHFTSLTAYLYNTEGKRVGTVMTYGQLHVGMVEVNVKRGDTATFDIYVYYDKQDIDHYELYIFNIQKMPTP